MDNFYALVFLIPPQVPLWIRESRRELDRQAFDLSISMLTSLINFDPLCCEAYRMRGLCYEKLGEVF